jgi:hypothetical protein
VYIYILAQDEVNLVDTEYQQQQQQHDLSVPIGPLNTLTVDQTLDGLQTTASFASLSSMDELARYFPDARTPGLPSFR